MRTLAHLREIAPGVYLNLFLEVAVRIKAVTDWWWFWFDLILYAPSTIFQLNRDGSSWVEPVLSKDKCLAQGPQRSDAGETRTWASQQALYLLAPYRWLWHSYCLASQE